VELLQVAGLRGLVKIRKEQQGIPLVLAGPSPNVGQLIDLAGYLDFFAIYPSTHAALSALKAHETLNLPGQIIKNRYSVQSKIGDGRLGTVFKATDTRRNRPIALKVLSASFSEGAIEQFLHQARQIIDLSHPNIVHIYDCDEDRGLSYMVEEFIEGYTLRELIDEMPHEPIPFDVALSIAENIASGLEYAHGHGVIHGDLKPKNVMLFGQQVKISDFGLGRLESGQKSLINMDVPLAVITARYVAPEQVLGHPIDARTDLYALGAMLYELFTGHPLFEGSDQEVLQHQRSTLPRPPRELNPKLSCSLEYLILKLLDKDPNKRYAKASQVRGILASLVTHSSTRFPRQHWPAFVGQEEALEQLLELWAKTEQGQGQLVFINGAAGVGKTRLTRELTQHIGQATLLTGKCRQSEGSPAYHRRVYSQQLR
jgi:serine/threonine protein kinase